MNVFKSVLPVLSLLFVVSCTPKTETTITLKDALKDKFYIGTAMNVPQINGEDSLSVKIIEDNFNSIVAENCMKSMYMQPSEGQFVFNEADRFISFSEKNNMHTVGHTLIWHSQAPDWFFVDDKGNDVSREVMIERMKQHITTIVKHYKGAIKGWDVVNEAILDDGEYRKSKFYEIVGEDFIPLAFQFAHEADPSAELYYNDYNEWHEGKRDAIVRLVKSLKEKGIRIDGVGMQAHMGMEYPTLDEYEKAIEAYASAGVKVMITEWDISALPQASKEATSNISDTVAYKKEINPYTAGLPSNVYQAWEARYLDFFKLFLKHHDKIDRVTLWGVTDNDSWKNDYPVVGRTDYPLLFDRGYKAKPVVEKMINLVNNTNNK